MPTPTAQQHPHAPDEVLAREQAHLERARDELRRMREATERLDASTAADAFNAAYLDLVLARRVASLQDDPRTTLFFGRIDCRTEHGEETLHIGRRHVSDARGDPVVVDWRAPISTALLPRLPHRADGRRPAPPLRHRPRPAHRLRGRAPHPTARRARARPTTARSSPREIERPRSGPMRDIVATIQPEQDEIVRADVATSICVQGAPGTGQDRRRAAPRGLAALRLPRAARPLRRARRRPEPGLPRPRRRRPALPRRGAGPARDRRHPARPRPRAGRGRHRRRRAQGRRPDGRGAADRGLAAASAGPSEALVLPRGSRRWRVPAYEVADELDALRAPRRALLGGPRPAPPAARAPRDAADRARRRLPRRPRAGRRRPHAAGQGLRQGPVAGRSTPPGCCFRLLAGPRVRSPRPPTASSARTSSGCCCGRSPPAPRGRPAGRVPTSPCSTSWPTCSSAPRASGTSSSTRPRTSRRCSCAPSAGAPRPAALTVLGDIAQGTTPWATDSWEAALAHLGRAAHELVTLDRGFRVPASSSTSRPGCCPRWLPGSAPRGRCATNPGRLDVVAADPARRSAGVVEAVRGGARRAGVGRRHRRPTRSSTRLAAALDRGRHRRTAGSTPSTATTRTGRSSWCRRRIAKGLEFDRVVVVEPAADRRRRARRAHRAAPALRRAHPRRLGADRRPRRAAARGPRRLTRAHRRAPGSGAAVHRAPRGSARRAGAQRREDLASAAARPLRSSPTARGRHRSVERARPLGGRGVLGVGARRPGSASSRRRSSAGVGARRRTRWR